MYELGLRLMEERKRLGMKQPDLGKAGNVSAQSQSNYEVGKRRPDADYLEAIAQAGVDVQYILTGVRSLNWPPAEEAAAQQIKKEELINTLELIRRETDRGLELVKKMG